MAEFSSELRRIQQEEVPKHQLIAEIVEAAKNVGYTVADIDDARPWGGFVRFDST